MGSTGIELLSLNFPNPLMVARVPSKVFVEADEGGSRMVEI
jgi:hypothetical protein